MMYRVLLVHEGVCDVRDVRWRLEIVLYAFEMLEGMHRVLLCMLEAVEGGLCLLEVPEVMRCVRLDMLDVLDVMRRVLLCVLEAVEGGLCLLELPEVMRRVRLCMLDVLDAMRRVLLCMLEEVRG